MEIVSAEFKDILGKVENSERLSFEDGVRLFNSKDILSVGYMANIVRERKNNNTAYFITNAHINYTNICINRCQFCAFSRSKEDQGAYSMSVDDILKKGRARSEE